MSHHHLLPKVKRSAITLLALFVIGIPAGESTIAQATGQDTKTVRKHLAELRKLGLVVRTGRYQSWSITPNNLLFNGNGNISLSSGNPETLIIIKDSIPIEDNNNKEREILPVVEALEAAGVLRNETTAPLFRRAHLKPSDIAGLEWALRNKYRDRYTPGLLINALLPMTAPYKHIPGCGCRYCSDPKRYTSGEYADWIEH